MRLYNQGKRQKEMDAVEASRQTVWHDDFEDRGGITNICQREARGHRPGTDDGGGGRPSEPC